jgi:aspartate racemase
MRRIGMIGGFSPESTVDYYKSIVERVTTRTKGEAYPEIVINSLDIVKLFSLIESGRREDLIDWLTEGVRALEKAGAEFAFISANTPHIVFDEVAARVSIPMISIVEATRDHYSGLGLRKLGLLGTKFTMGSDFFQRAFAKNGIDIYVPDPEDQVYIQGKYLSEIEGGVYDDATRKAFRAIIKRMATERSLDGVILGCTEFPMLLAKEGVGIPCIDTTKIHVECIVRACLGE